MNKRKQLLAKIETESEVQNIASIPPYTVVELIYIEAVTEKTFRGVGLTKKTLRDVWNTELGISIARGRAAKDIARQMNRWFRNRV